MSDVDAQAAADLLVTLMAPMLQARADATAALAEVAALVGAQPSRQLPDPSALPDGSLVEVINGHWVNL